MNAAQWERVRAAAEHALALPKAERARWLDEACAGDSELRAAVEAQVEACEQVSAGGDALDVPAAAFAAPLLGASITAGAAEQSLAAALAGRYDILGEVGRGGSATVYLAHDQRHDRRVALKVVDPSLGRSLSAERFLREIRVTAGLAHPHILPLFDSGRAGTEEGGQGRTGADQLLYYVMPFIEGESLRDRIERAGPLDVAAVIRLVRDVASALDYAHRRGILHRDIKPANILLADGHAIVADFGIARAVKRARGANGADGMDGADGADGPDQADGMGGADGYGTLTGAGISPGTPAYMAPEQVRGGTGVDERTDLYALGLVAYEAVTGTHPFASHDPHALLAARLEQPPRPLADMAPSVPSAFAALVMRLLATNPDARPGSAAEVLRELEAVRRRTPRRRFTAAAAALIVLASAAVLALVARDRLRPGARPPAALAVSQQAYDLYLQGRYHWLRRGRENVVRAIEHFSDAVAVQPDFARAHAGLAMAYVVLPVYVPDPADSTTARMLEHGRRAIELDSTLADAHVAVGAALDGMLRYDSAEASYRRAIALEPGSAGVRHVYGMALLHRGRTDEAIAELRRAVDLDPMAVMPATGLAAALLWARRFDDAEAAARRALELDSAAPFAHFTLGLSQVLSGDAAAGVRTLEAAPGGGNDPRLSGALVLAYAAAGDRERAAAARAALHADTVWGSIAAEVADLVFGDVEPLVRAFGSARRQRELIAAGVIFGCNPLLDPAWDDPRFAGALAGTGIERCDRAAPWPVGSRS